MCVIAYMPKNKRLSNDDIYYMFATNPDGAGIAYPNNGKVIIEKGFFDIDELVNTYETIPVNVPMILHCRIATSGGITEQTCHPFALSATIEGLNSRSCNFAVAHNGVLSGLGSRKISDTQEYITQVLAPLRKMSKAHTVKALDTKAGTVINATIQSNRLVIMDTRGNTIFYGKWHNYKGCRISNSLFSNRKDFSLPFPDCAVCTGRYDCASYGPFCETIEDVSDSFAYYEEVYKID